VNLYNTFHFRVAFDLARVARRGGSLARGRHRPSPPGRTHRNRGPSVRTLSLPRRSRVLPATSVSRQHRLGLSQRPGSRGRRSPRGGPATRGCCDQCLAAPHGWPRPTPARPAAVVPAGGRYHCGRSQPVREDVGKRTGTCGPGPAMPCENRWKERIPGSGTNEEQLPRQRNRVSTGLSIRHETVLALPTKSRVMFAVAANAG
jgi:hypothetical protein